MSKMRQRLKNHWEYWKALDCGCATRAVRLILFIGFDYREEILSYKLVGKRGVATVYYGALKKHHFIMSVYAILARLMVGKIKLEE